MVLMVGSASGICARSAAATSSLSALTRSSGNVRLTATVRSMKVLSPTSRARTSRRRPRPAPGRRSSVILAAAPGGAVSVSVSMVRRPSRQPASSTSTATASAATESAHHRPKRMPTRPTSTASEPHRSEEKCSASAASAWLEVFSAVRESARERTKSTTIDTRMTPKAQALASTPCPSCAMQTLGRFPDHHAGEQEQQRGFRQRRDRLHLAVAVVMLLVGRLARDAHGGIGHGRRAQIDQRMTGLRQDRQRAGGDADDRLGDGQPGRGRDRGQRDLFFFVLHDLGFSAKRARLRLWHAAGR